MPTALSQSGGGNLGAVQVGMLHALAARGIAPDLLVGTSAGALNAAFVAAHGTDEDALHALARVWARLDRRDVFPLEPSRVLRSLTGLESALCSDRGLRGLLEEHLRLRRLEDAPLPLHVVATDFLSGSEVLLSHGDALSAVLASCAIPGCCGAPQSAGR